MINILRDIQGITGTNVVVPFTLEKANLRKDPVKVELIGKIDGRATTLPDGLVYVVQDGGTEVAITNITPVDFDSHFIVRIDTTVHDIEQLYIRVYNKDLSFVTPKIHIAKDMELEFVTAPKEAEFRPKTLKITDKVSCTYNGALASLTQDKFDITVSICNNASSATPVWEDVTSAYLSKQPLVFKNSQNDAGVPWAVSIKYQINKTISDSTVEIADIAIMVL